VAIPFHVWLSDTITNWILGIFVGVSATHTTGDGTMKEPDKRGKDSMHLFKADNGR
jgi:hypothetical protein